MLWEKNLENSWNFCIFFFRNISDNIWLECEHHLRTWYFLAIPILSINTILLIKNYSTTMDCFLRTSDFVNGIVLQPNSKNFTFGWEYRSIRRLVYYCVPHGRFMISRKHEGEFKRHDHFGRIQETRYFLNLRTRISKRILLTLECLNLVNIRTLYFRTFRITELVKPSNL